MNDRDVAQVDAVMRAVSAMLRSAPNFDGRIGDVEAAVRAALDAARAAERERCAAWCDNRAAYYNTVDDDGPESRRGQGAKACADVIRWPANWGQRPEGAR